MSYFSPWRNSRELRSTQHPLAYVRTSRRACSLYAFHSITLVVLCPTGRHEKDKGRSQTGEHANPRGVPIPPYIFRETVRVSRFQSSPTLVHIRNAPQYPIIVDGSTTKLTINKRAARLMKKCCCVENEGDTLHRSVAPTHSALARPQSYTPLC